jgi:hypothetical protein
VKSVSKFAAYTSTKPIIRGGSTFTCKRARVEARSRYLGIPPEQLGAIKNLFADVDLFSISTAESLTNHQVPAWDAFLQKEGDLD